MWTTAIMAALVAVAGCGGAEATSTSSHGSNGTRAEVPTSRHAGLVDREVLRSVTGRAAGASDQALAHARGEAVRLVSIEVDALPEAEVARLRLDVSIGELTITTSTIRAKALIAVNTVGPPEQMHAILQGAGTVRRGSSESEDVELVIGGAIEGALRRFDQVIARTR